MASRMGEYRHWAVRIMPRQGDEEWTASVEVWPPGTDGQHIGGFVVPFSSASPDREALIEAGMAAARRYIDDAIRRG